MDDDTAEVLLHELPRGHELRTRLLAGAQLHNRAGKGWRDIPPSWAIAKSCYDQLGDAWTDTNDFRFPIVEQSKT